MTSNSKYEQLIQAGFEIIVKAFDEQNKNYENTSCKYEFKFKTKEEVVKENLSGKNYWFAVGQVLDFETDKDYRELLGDFYESCNWYEWWG